MKPIELNIAVLALIGSLTVFSFPTHSSAQEMEEVIVTADLFDRSVLDLATSVSVIDQNKIEERGALQLEQLLNLAPNVNFSSGASRGRYIQIRGIGERSEFIEPLNASVGVTLDGIDLTGISTIASTLDIAQVEILRGPQGTLYGANALAGLINLKSNAPSDILEGRLKVEAGNFGHLNFSGTINTPINDNLGLRLSAMKTTGDGFIDNIFLNRDDTNNIDEEAFKAKLAWRATDALSFDLTAIHADVDNGYDAFSLDNTRETRSDNPGQDRQKTNAYSLNTVWEINDNLLFEALVSNANSDIEYGYDEDWSFVGLCDGTPCEGFEYSSVDNYLRENDTLTTDIRLRSNASSSEFSWVAGYYYRDQDRTLLRQYTFDSDFSSQFDTENQALYAEISIPLADRLTLSTGARVENYEGDYQDSSSESASPDEDLWGGKISLEFDISDASMIYGLISRGYKVGGFNANPALTEEQRDYDTEFMWNYEAGVKGQWADGKLQANLSLFFQDRDDVQTSSSVFIPNEGEPGGEFIEFTSNAARGSNYGLEAETIWHLSDRASVFLTLGILDATFDDFENPSHVDATQDETTGDSLPVDLSGRDQAHAPSYMFNVGTDLAFTDSLSINLDIEGKDSFFFSDNHNEQSDSYVLLNARLNYELDGVKLSLWGRNLTDQDVEIRGFFFSNDFGNDPRNFYAPEPYHQFGEPRVFGVSGTYSF